MMFAHGLSIAVLFAVAGEVRARTGTMRMDELGGLARSMPRLALLFGLGMFASVGLPGFANFASELMVFFGAFSAASGSFKLLTKTHLPLPGLDGYQIATICGLWGVVMSAVYMLRAYRRVFLGQPGRPAPGAVAAEAGTSQPKMLDLLDGRRWAMVLLIVGLVVVGFRPRTLLDTVKPAIVRLMPLTDDTSSIGSDGQASTDPAVSHAASPAQP